MHEGLHQIFLAAAAVLRRTGNQTQYSLVMTGFDFEPRFDSSSMIFDNPCSRCGTVNLFCNAFGNYETKITRRKLRDENYETWQAAALRVEPKFREAGARRTASRHRCGCPCEPSKVRAVGEIFAVNPNGRLPPPRKRCHLFLTWIFDLEFSCSNASSCCSHAVEYLDSPQHDDDGQYQRGHRQYTL